MNDTPIRPPYYGPRASLYSAAIFLGIGVYVPFFSPWLKSRGLSDSQVAIILAAPLYARAFLSPILTFLADRFGSLGRGAALYATVSTLTIAILGTADGFLPLLWLSATAMVFWNALVPIGDAAIIHGVKHFGLDYSRTRLWGSVAFIVANLAGGLAAQELGSSAIYPLLLSSFVVGTLFSLGLPFVPPIEKRQGLGDLKLCFQDRTMRRALFAGAFIGSSHAAFYAYGTIYWESQGFSKSYIGVLWSAGVVAEIVLFYFARRIQGFGARRFLLVGGIAALIRWLLFPHATHPVSAFVLQWFHALTFASTHLGVMMAIGAASLSGHTARIQAGYQFLGGLFLATAMLTTGPFFTENPRLVFTMMAALGGLGLLIAFRLARGLRPSHPPFHYQWLRPRDPAPVLSAPDSPYRAVIVGDLPVDAEWRYALSRQLVETQCRSMLAWGVEGTLWDDAVDESLLEKYDHGEIPTNAQIMTTWHNEDSLAEVIWQAKNLFPDDPSKSRILVIHIAEQADEKRIQRAWKEAEREN